MAEECQHKQALVEAAFELELELAQYYVLGPLQNFFWILESFCELSNDHDYHL